MQPMTTRPFGLTRGHSTRTAALAVWDEAGACRNARHVAAPYPVRWFAFDLWPIGPAICRFLWLGARFRGRQAELRRAPWSEQCVFRLLRWRLTVIRHRRLIYGLSGVLVCAAGAVIWFGGREPERVMEAVPRTESERAEVAAPHGPPAEIWLVESSDRSDLYSNGLRVDNRYGTHTGPRVYAVLPRDGEVEPETLEWRERPVGLVFHTTETDLAPFAKTYNHHIRYQGQQLLLSTPNRNVLSLAK